MPDTSGVVARGTVEGVLAPSRIAMSLAVIGLLVAPGLVDSPVSADPPPGARGVPDKPVMIGWHEKSDNVDALRANERALGKQFALVRMYQQWTLPGKKVDEMVADGRLVVVSHKPPETISWLRIALGLEDAFIHELAAKYKSYGREIVVVFHHEPHDDALDLKTEPSSTYGLSSNYVAAFRRIHNIFVIDGAQATVGGNVFFGYGATTPWILEGSPRGAGDALYPGDDVVDVLTHDRYNWASCRGHDWEEFADNWGPVVKLAARQRKPLIIGEFGAPPNGGRRNDWFRKAAAWMKTDPDARDWLWGFAYFHSLHSGCKWDFMNQGDDGRVGWTEAFTKDSHFTGTPVPLPRS